MTAQQDVEVLAAKLTEAQRKSLLALDTRDVEQAHYAPFQGCSQGIFQIAPGWRSMELTQLGAALRSHLIGTGNG